MGFADLIIICYALGSIGSIAGFFPRWAMLRKPAACLIGAGFIVHTLAVFRMFFWGDFAEVSRGDLLHLMAWSLVLVYCVAWWRLRVAFLGLTAGPLALVLFFSAAIAGSVDANLPQTMTGVFFVLHLGTLFLNVALLTLGFGSALFFLSLHRKLKSKIALPETPGQLPALATVEKINTFVVFTCFPLFSVGLITGFFWAYLARGAIFTSDPKEIISVLLWFLYAFAFGQRAFFGWRGRRGALMLILLFAATLFSVLGVNFFMDSHHNFFQSPVF
ncbi:MAG: Cytochrome c biogenesis protein CcsA [Desulfovibrio sp.]